MPDSNPNPDVCIPTSETRTATGRTHVAEGVRLRFLERIDLHHERADDPEQTVSALGGQRQDYGPITAPSDAGPGRQKWVYVFKRAAGGHVSLSAEGRFDTDGTFTLVDWQSKSWTNEDRRPAETEKQADDPAHLALDHDPESTELFAFLVHTQLPWHRLQQYIGVNPEVPLEYRAVKIAPGDGDHVVRNGDSGVDTVLLTDYVNHVDRLHQKYRAAIRKKQQYQQDTADKLLHAGLTRSVVESYLDKEYPDQRTKDESPTTPGDPLADEVPGAPLDRLSEFETEVEDSVREFDDEINRWAGWLYDGWLSSPMYETARADGVMYASDPANFGDEQTKRAEEGLCRDLELLDEAVRSDDGQAYLQERFGEESGELGGSGAKGLAFATKFLKRLADVPADDLDDLYDSAEAGSRSKVLGTAGQRRLRAYSILLEQLEVLRMTAGPGGSVQKTYARRQVAILQPLSDAAGAEPDGAGGRSSGPTRAWTADPNGPDAHPSTSAQRASAMLTDTDGEPPRSGASAEDLLGLRFATVGRTDGRGTTVRQLRAETVEGRALTLRGDGTAAVVDVEGIAAADVPREEVFVATKVNHRSLPAGTYGDVMTAVDGSLDRLGLDRLDLLYVHWPVADYDPDETLAAFEDLRDAGTVDHIGLCNCTPAILEEALATLDAPLFAHQVEMHPFLPQAELHRLAVETDHWLVAYSPLAHGGVLEQPTLQEIADDHAVGPAGIALAWLLDQETVAAVPKASTMAHLRQNLDSRGVELSADEVARIEAIDRQERTIDPDGAPWNRA